MRSLLDRFGRVGLRWRLAGWIAALTLACLSVAFLAVYQGTGDQVHSQINSELSDDAKEFAHALALSGARGRRELAAAAARYVHAQPFTESSTLLFAVVPGQETSTNSPDLFHQATLDDGESAAEQRRENVLSSRLLTQRTGFSTLPVPDLGSLFVYKQAVRVPGAGHMVIGVGEPTAAVAHARLGVANAFIVAGLLGLAGALLGAYLIGTRISRPLRRMAAVAARVDAGDLAPRIRSDRGAAREIRILSDAFDHMLDRLDAAFAGQRAFVADASHELRTPLTVVRGQLEVLATNPDPSLEEVHRVEQLVGAEIGRISRLVDDLLLLARSGQAQFLRYQEIDLRDFLEGLWESTTVLDERRFECGELPDGTLRADPDRLAQALRNLLENAIVNTAAGSGVVRLRVERAGLGGVRVIVEDDGPGIPASERERVFERFHRTDSARDRASGGAGLGLAIVDAIARAHGGSARALASSLGGARVEIELPGFEPARTRSGTQTGVRASV